MILGTKARYAVMAMVELAARGSAEKPVTLASIAESEEIPLPYLEQIFARLRRGGLVRSVRGPGGGYTLGREANRVKVAEIIAAVDESLKMTRCDTSGDHGCMSGKARCATHDLWDGLSNQIQRYLSDISLEDVCKRRVGKKNPCETGEFFLKGPGLAAPH